MTLDINLYDILHREIGLKSAKVAGFSLLGIKEMKVELSEGETLPERREDFKADNRSFPISKKKSSKTQQASHLDLEFYPF